MLHSESLEQERKLNKLCKTLHVMIEQNKEEDAECLFSYCLCIVTHLKIQCLKITTIQFLTIPLMRQRGLLVPAMLTGVLKWLESPITWPQSRGWLSSHPRRCFHEAA